MKYLLLFLVLFTACVPSENLEDSVCVKRCITVEGTILNYVTNEPFVGLKLKALYVGFFMDTTDKFGKAKVETDANGFYSLSFEIFEEELAGGGNFIVSIEDTDEVYVRSNRIYIFQRNGGQLDFDNTYTANGFFRRPAFINYDMDGLVNLKADETARILVEYEFDLIQGTHTSSVGQNFNEYQTEDRGELKVPADMPLKFTASIRNMSTNEIRILKEEQIMLEHNEDYFVEVDI